MDTAVISIMRPFLPDADTLFAHLRRIDANRWFSDFGPLRRELENRLATHWYFDGGSVLSVSNATRAGLVPFLVDADAAILTSAIALFRAVTALALPCRMATIAERIDQVLKRHGG